MWVTWTPAVLREMNSSSPISPFERPAATSRRTSISRADSVWVGAAGRIGTTTPAPGPATDRRIRRQPAVRRRGAGVVGDGAPRSDGIRARRARSLGRRDQPAARTEAAAVAHAA